MSRIFIIISGVLETASAGDVFGTLLALVANELPDKGTLFIYIILPNLVSSLINHLITYYRNYIHISKHSLSTTEST